MRRGVPARPGGPDGRVEQHRAGRVAYGEPGLPTRQSMTTVYGGAGVAANIAKAVRTPRRQVTQDPGVVDSGSPQRENSRSHSPLRPCTKKAMTRKASTALTSVSTIQR